jgi:hypothetical protein
MSSPEDVKMEEASTTSGTLLKLRDPLERNIFLVKLPQWLAESIRSSKPGTSLGESSGSLDEICDEITLRLDKRHAGANKPSEYSLSLPAAQQDLRVMEQSDSVTVVSKVASTVHMIPKRGAKYTSVLRERLTQSDQTQQHRTLVNEEEYGTSRTAVKLFQRMEAQSSPEESALGTDAAMRMSTKRMRQLDELPQKQTRAMGSASVSLDDALMETLVSQDEGWALQQLSKSLKEKGVTAPISQLKAKLLEICVYQRRGEDNFPKYYLKSEYK